MSRLASFCVTLIAFVVAINTTCADKGAQNITTVLSVSELYSELSVVSDNICNNHEKNVAFDVIVVDSKAPAVIDESRSKRQAAAHGDKRRDRHFKDRPRADQKSLLLIFDGTGSMHDDLQQLRSGAEEIITDFSTREDSPIFNYVLVVFRDPSVEAPFETRNPDELLEKLKYINVAGGGDCPEMALSGLRIGLRLALPNSLAYVFSDASAKDHGFYSEVVELIQAKQVTVNFLLTGDCHDQTSPGYRIYQRLSRVSNGQVYDMHKNNVKDVLLAIRHTVSHNYAALKSVDVENAGTSKTDLSVDKSITKLSVSITGENPTLSIRNPSNETVQSGDSLTLKNLKLVNIKDPNEGVWRIEARADSSHSIRLSALSDLKFEFGFSLSDAGKKSETSFQPLMGHKNALSIFVSDPLLIEELSNVTIILIPASPSESSTKFTIPLRRQTESHYATPPFDVPRQMFKIQLNGVDAYGNSLERLISTGLVSSFGSAPEVSIEASQKEIYENDKLYLTCFVVSHIPVNISISHNGRIIERLFSNQSNELEFSINDVQLKDTGTYSCLATNAIGNQAQEMGIKVLTAPKVKISANWQEMKENFNYSIACAVDGVKEKRVNISWLTDDDTVLQTDGEVYNFLARASLNNRIIKCRIQSNEFTIEDSIKLNVLFAPRFLNSQPNQSVQVFGSDINLDCTTVANPQSDATQWFFTPKHPSTRHKIAHDAENYALTQVVEEGLYECLASNKLGSVLREFNISLAPRERPKVVTPHDIIIANQSESIELVCECYSCLPILNFTWTHESQRDLHQSYFIENVQENSFKAVVKIDSVSEADSGAFECIMYNNLGDDKVSIELLVQTTPKIEAILINDESKREVWETVEVLEGESISIECVVDAFPEPSIFWAKNDARVAEESFLDFENVSLADDSVYECIAENSMGTTKKTINLNVNYPPRRKRHVDTDLHEFMEKRHISLECDLVGNPKPTITWFKNSRKIGDKNEAYELSDDESILNFQAHADDNGIYECKGVNRFGSSSIEFTVVVLTIPKILQPDDEVVEVKRGEQLKLSCDSVGYPIPHTRYVKDNVILSQESTFELESTSPNMSGALHCFAENKIGTAEKIFYINVVQLPQITTDFENVTLMSHETKTLVCVAEGIPSPKIQWMHQNGELLSPNEILTLTSSSKQGTALCEAINSHGKDAKYINVNIINKPVKLPIAADLLAAQNIRENDDLELICPFENYNDIAWTFNNQTLDDIEHKTIDKKLIIHNVNRMSGGEWTCFVSNAAGNASFSYDISILASPVIFASWNLNDRVSDFLFTESDIDEKVFKVGENLVLNCTAQGTPLPMIQWRKSGDLVGEGEILTIENLQFHHSDIYTCSAENDQGAVKKFFKVDVISGPFIDSPNSLQREFQKSIGDSIILKCTSIIANPPPIFFWFKDGEILDDESDDHLEIDSLNASHDGAYRCFAKNRYGSAKLDFKISMYEPAKIVKAEEEVIDESMLKLSCVGRGSPLPIVSWIQNGHIVSTTSKLNIEKLLKTVKDDSIYFDGYGNGISYLDPFKIQLSKQKFYSQLTQIDSKALKLDVVFKNRVRLQSSKFNCYCFNALGRDEKSVEVSVKKKPFVRETSMHHLTQEQEILEHLPLLLSCLVDAIPEPKIVWYKNGLQIYENETIRFLNNNKFLSIEETFSWHSGNYSCMSKNSEGELELKFHIVILSPPRFSDYTIIPSSSSSSSLLDVNYFGDKSRMMRNNGSNSSGGGGNDNENTINVLRGADVVLECWVEASPAAKIHWVKLNFFDSSKNEILREEKNFLTLNAIKESSNFMCHANNSIGSVQKLFFVNVQHAPEFLSASEKMEERVTVQLHHSVNFECKIRSSPEAKIQWSHNSTSLAKFDNNFYFTSDSQIMRIINVDKSHEGKFVCKAENALGSVEKVFYVTVEIPVQFSPWGEWSACTATCGSNGIQYRSRTCILLDATPSYNCSGENILVRKCNDIPCPIDGGWGKWSKWSTCPSCFDEKSHANPPLQKRTRKCDSPIPAFGGLHCQGVDEEEKNCAIDVCPVDGGWSVWSSWSTCSKTCGQGLRSRKRLCNDPAPKYNGKFCDGDNLEYEECNVKVCSNFFIRRSLGNDDDENSDDFDTSTETFREMAEFEIKSDEKGGLRPYQFMQHREIEYSPPPKNFDSLPKIKITLDTYKPISKDLYEQHLNDLGGNEMDDDYFEPEFSASSPEVDSFEMKSATTQRNCGRGFKYNSIYRQCEEVDECKSKETNSCRRNERCVNTIGSYRCERA